jgi:hypothetical protein
VFEASLKESYLPQKPIAIITGPPWLRTGTGGARLTVLAGLLLSSEAKAVCAPGKTPCVASVPLVVALGA